jgi:DNA repair protein RecO (recombination protein O)
MSEKLHHTHGIVLRSVRYGETSLVVTMLTSLFGVQSYLVNGVRTRSRKGEGRANLFQPSAILDLVVYHNEFKQLQRIREFRWAIIYQRLLSDVPRNAIALFMVELLGKCLKQPESNPDLYHFAEDCLMHLDQAEDTVAANFPLFFALHLPVFFGFRFHDNYSAAQPYLDLQEGNFCKEPPEHHNYLDEELSSITAQLLRVQQAQELAQFRLHHLTRRRLLEAYQVYYNWQVQDFGSLKTLQVLKEIL